MNEYREAARRWGLPEYMHEGICGWIERGIMPGDFLCALLRNDLMESFARADEMNTAAMRSWAMFLHNDAPSHCYGSGKNFDAWHERGGLAGR